MGLKQRVDKLEAATEGDGFEVVKLAYRDEPWAEVLKRLPHLRDFKGTLVGINNFLVERPS